MKHIHIDKAIGGTNDGKVTPYIRDYPVLRLIKKREPDPVVWSRRADVGHRTNYETEDYRLERFHADDCVITFWVTQSTSPAAALCQILLRYVPKEDLAVLT